MVLSPSPAARWGAWRRGSQVRPHAGAPVVGRYPIEGLVEGNRGVDEGEVAERQWEVANLHTAQGDLFGVQADVVCGGQHLSNARRVLLSARPGKRVDVEERAE